MSVIRVENMTKDFGHGRGIFNVDFQVGKGEVLGFLGPNGAGKTTTIRHLLGFTQPSKGTAEIMGLDCLGQHSQVMQYVGYLPGEIALPEGLTGWQFIRMMQQMRQIESDDYLHYLLDLFEFDPSGSTKKMSLGDKRKLAVITAFMGNPDILILDEPTSGLDPLMQEKFIQFMVEEKRRGKTILLSSHIFPEVEATCDRIIIIKEGKLVAEVNAKELKNEDEKQYSLYFDNYQDLTDAVASLGGEEHEIEALRLDVQVQTSQLPNFLGGLRQLRPSKITENRFDLESYFLDFYRSDRIFKEI
ncbi:TPA: ABC transporter ATP-binding protein [Streptococcus suis]|nr:ABC transporter ATP-binding protein [Streptococcus suis]